MRWVGEAVEVWYDRAQGKSDVVGLSRRQVDVEGEKACTAPDSARGVISGPPRYSASTMARKNQLRTYTTKEEYFARDDGGGMPDSRFRHLALSGYERVRTGIEVDCVDNVIDG